MNPFPRAVAQVFAQLCRPSYASFAQACKDPAAAQARVLEEILRAQARTDLGRSLGLSGREGYSEFCGKVSPQTYDGPLAAWVEKQMRDPGADVLTPGGAKVFERTSGSSGLAKPIPYNRALLASFERYFRIWAYDLCRHGPRLSSYQTYITVSPSTSSYRETGLGDDSEYLSWPLRVLLKPFLAVPLDLKNVREPEHFRDLLCAHLANSPDLEILSLWHPSLFLALVDHLAENRRAIARLLREDLRFRARPDVQKKLAGHPEPAELWPALKLLSAWDGGNSGPYALRLQKLFPNALFQPKGLLATEAAISVPIVGVGAIPLVDEVFLEFLSPDGSIRLLPDTRAGERYRLLVTQKSGFLRYALGDEIEILDSSWRGMPALRFLGRTGEIADLVGEKICSANAIDLWKYLGVKIFCLLPILPPAGQPYYLALVDEAVEPESLAEAGDRFLRRYHHYGYARDVGQLRALRAVMVPRLNERLLNFYRESKGMKLGDIKVKVLLEKPQDAKDLMEYLNINL
jgi:hypothetical protein